MQFRENRSLLSQARASLLKTAIFVVAFLAITGAVFSLLNPGPVLAQAQDFGLTAAQGFGLPTMDIRQIAVNVIRVLLGLLGLVALGIVLYAGFQWMTAGDNAEKVANSKKLLINGAIGLLIIVSAYAIVSFFFSALGYGGLFGGGAVRREGTPGGFGGALGNGPIQSHYPPRNAVDVPRNTSIIVTFKEALDTTSVEVGRDSVAIVTREQYDADNFDALTDVTIGTTDNKTFVFTPVQYLGSPDNAMGYVVLLGKDIKKFDQKPVFTGRYLDYIWSFEVSNKLDVIPPTVTSVIPLYSNPVASEVIDENPNNNTVARNAIIQINFSEAVNPLAVSGEAKIDSNGALTFGNIVVANVFPANNTTQAGVAQNSFGLTGRFEISNQYRTVEFTTDQECGVNSCGEKVYCLPGDAQIQVNMKSARLTELANKNPDLPFLSAIVLPMTGVTDVANNAMDGNRNSIPDDSIASYNLNSSYPLASINAVCALDTPCANGLTCANGKCQLPGDNFQWGFFTNNKIDLVPPTVVSYSPVAKSVGVQPTQQLTATFDKYLSASTIRPDAGYGDGYCGCTNDSQCNDNETCNEVKGMCEVTATGERSVCYKHTGGAECKPVVAGNDEDEELCIEHEHVALLQPENLESVGYWMMTRNDPNQLISQSTTIMDHVEFIKNEQYGAYYGSGIRDLFQNCYIPNAAPGCPRVGGDTCATDTECQTKTNTPDSVCQPNRTCSYVSAPGWLGTYPTCDLTGVTLSTYGSFNLGFLSVSGVNKNVQFPAYAWDKPVTTLASELATNDYFKSLPKKNTANVFLYFEQGASAGLGKLFLVMYAGKDDLTAGEDARTLTLNISSVGGTATYEPAVLSWTDRTHVAKIYELSNVTSLSAIPALNLLITVASGEVGQLQLAFPGGTQILSQTSPLSLSSVDTQAPLVKSGDFKVQYRQDGTNYIIDITLNAAQFSDLAEAYVDMTFSAAELTRYNLELQPLNDAGRNSDQIAGDLIWTYQFSIPGGATVAAAIAGSEVLLNHLSKDYAGNSVQLDKGDGEVSATDDITAQISAVTP